MKLSKGILRPGKILEVCKENNGNIKASAPGLFSEEDDVNMLPPIMYWFGHQANAYTSPKVGDEVWILNLSDNPLQLYWFRKDKFVENNTDLMKETNVEILCNREKLGTEESTWATIYFSDDSGWIIKNDSSIIQIRANGSILLDIGKDNRKIDINDNNISIGSINKSAEPAVLGDKLVESLNIIKNMFKQIELVSKTNPYTKPISLVIKTYLTQFENSIEPIKSKNITLD